MEGELGGLCVVVLAMEITMEALKAEVVRDEGVKGMGRRIVGEVVTKEWDAVCAV